MSQCSAPASPASPPISPGRYSPPKYCQHLEPMTIVDAEMVQMVHLENGVSFEEMRRGINGEYLFTCNRGRHDRYDFVVPFGDNAIFKQITYPPTEDQLDLIGEMLGDAWRKKASENRGFSDLAQEFEISGSLERRKFLIGLAKKRMNKRLIAAFKPQMDRMSEDLLSKYRTTRRLFMDYTDESPCECGLEGDCVSSMIRRTKPARRAKRRLLEESNEEPPSKKFWYPEVEEF